MPVFGSVGRSGRTDRRPRLLGRDPDPRLSRLGKVSSFALHLCSVLMEKSLSPILIRLGDVDVSVHASSALPRAVKTGSNVAADDLFLNGRLFNEKVPFGAAE